MPGPEPTLPEVISLLSQRLSIVQQSLREVRLRHQENGFTEEQKKQGVQAFSQACVACDSMQGFIQDLMHGGSPAP